MPDFATGDREVEMINTSLIENLTLVIGWGQLIFCNALLVAVLALVSAKSKPEIVFQE